MIEAIVVDFKAELGYALAKPFWKKGYMAEALIPIKDALLKNKQIKRIWAVCDIENYGSKKVMEKIDMNCEGILKKWILHPNRSTTPRDCFVYSIVR